MSSVVPASVIDILASMASHAVSKNLDRNETVIRALKRLGIERSPSPDDFDSIYVYTLVEYGVFKPKPILEFFRNERIQDAFRKALYEKDLGIIQKEADDVAQWNFETGELGRIDYDPRRELNNFAEIFQRVVHLTRSPSEAEQFNKIEDIHNIIVTIRSDVDSLQSETTIAQQIARDRPELWEYLLTLELMRGRFKKFEEDFDDLSRGLHFHPSRYPTSVEFPKWAQAKMTDLSNLIQMMTLSLNEELMPSWGPFGEPGSVDLIHRAVNKINDACSALLDWEIDLSFTEFPDDVDHVRHKMAGWGKLYFDEVRKLPVEIGKIIAQPKPEVTYRIEITFEPPGNIDEVNEAITNLI